MNGQRTRRVRRQVDVAGLRAAVAADVNLAVSTGTPEATVASVRQDVQINQHQGRNVPSRQHTPTDEGQEKP